MNLAIECDVVLSKKLEAICKDGSPLSLHIEAISGNKGRAVLHLVSKNGVTADEVMKIGETSLPIKIVEATDEGVSIGETKRFGTLLDALPLGAEGIAVVTTPDHPAGSEYVPIAPVQIVVSQPKTTQPQVPEQSEVKVGTQDTAQIVLMALRAAGVAIPPGILDALKSPSSKQVQQPKPQNPPEKCIRTLEELKTELQQIPGIDETLKIPTDRKLTPREADALLSRTPRLRKKAFVRNLLQSQLMISDLYTTFDGGGSCLCLLPGAAFDLSRIPARNILNSTDLTWACDTGKCDLVDSATYVACFKKVNEDMTLMGKPELPVYSGNARMNPTESSGGMADRIANGLAMQDDGSDMNIIDQGSDPISINVNDSADDSPASVPWEESPAMQALIGGMPTSRAGREAKPPRRT